MENKNHMKKKESCNFDDTIKFDITQINDEGGKYDFE